MWLAPGSPRRLRGSIAAGFAVVLCAVSIGVGNPVRAGAAGAPATVPGCVIPATTRQARDAAIRDRTHVVGNHFVDGRGDVWVPYGISLFGGLEDGDQDARWLPTLGAVMAQIKAAPFWKANEVRIQWSEANIFHDVTPTFGVNVPFLLALCAQVRQVRSQGEVAVRVHGD
jgi:hypothetical protein